MRTGQVITIRDGESVRAELLSSPNILGLVECRRYDKTFFVYHLRCSPLDDEARRLLSGGDRFVTRPVFTAVPENPTVTVEPKIDGWNLDELIALHVYLIGETQRYQRMLPSAQGRKREVYIAAHTSRMAAARFVKQAIKFARAKGHQVLAGITEEQARDPVFLLRQAHNTMYRLASRVREATQQEGMTDVELGLHRAIGDYLDHYQKGVALKAEKK